MTESASASNEQSSGIDQINKAITQMDTVVQMNASLVEEATAAATSMAHQATGLARAVSEFRLEDETAGAPALGLASAAAQQQPALTRGPERQAALGQRREPAALAAAEADEWKEF